MVFNDSHPIRATITIYWDDKKLKEEFDNVLRNHCDIHTVESKRKEIFKLTTNSTEFYNKYDIIGQLKSETPKTSYILKEELDPLRTSFDMFNDKENIKESVGFVREQLKKTINNKKIYYFWKWVPYKLTVVYSINGINFRNSSFFEICKGNLPFLLGLFLVPLTKLVNIYLKTDNNLNNLNPNNTEVVKSIQTLLVSTDGVEVAVSIIIIIGIYYIVSIIKWRQKQNVIRF